MKKLNTKIFVDRAKKIFGNFYDYTLCNYNHSLKKVEIICPKHGIFKIKPSNHINNKQGCYFCGKKNFSEAKKIKIKDFFERICKRPGFPNYDFSLIKFNSIWDKVKVTCNEHGEYVTTPRKLLRSSSCWGCEACRRKLDKFDTKIFIEKSRTAHNNYYQYGKTRYVDAHTDITVTCPKHGDFIVVPHIHIRGGGFCPKCTAYVSSYESEIVSFLKQNRIKNLKTSYRRFKGIKEIDIICEDAKLAIEFNGLYWHSEFFKNNNYHLEKTNKMNNFGFRLIHIFEDEWKWKKKICKSILLNSLGKTALRVFARKCQIKKIDNKICRSFLEENHIQGNCISKIRYGLFYNNQIIAVASFGSGRKCLGSNKRQGEWELLRFCTKLNHNVIGGASKLFSAFIKENNPVKITSYCDRRWGTGNLYFKLNFSLIKTTSPNYFYVKDGKRHNRFAFRKDRLVKMGYDRNKTEREIMKNLGYYRIYDCGCMKFQWTKTI